MANGQLTNKQQVFVNEYLKCWNASESARRAGYNGRANVVGPRLLANVSIATEIKRCLNELTMSADEILVRLTAQARASLEDFFAIDADSGFASIDLRKAEQLKQMGVLKKLVIHRGNRIEIELYDAQSALMHLAKLRGMIVDRNKVEDWRSEAIDVIRRGEVSYEALAAEFDHDLATQLFAAAGVPVEIGAGAPEHPAPD